MTGPMLLKALRAVHLAFISSILSASVEAIVAMDEMAELVKTRLVLVSYCVRHDSGEFRDDRGWFIFSFSVYQFPV